MTELKMFEHLKTMFPANEYALLPQVRNGTGYNGVTRTADAVAISLWPSRGIDMIGFEFKDSRSDVLKELANTAKSDEIGKHCAYWWLVVSNPKYISKDELPSAWGLIAINDGAIKKIVKAPRREAVPPNLSLIASLMKAAAGSLTGENEVQRRIQAAVEKAQKDSYESHKADIARRERDAEASRTNIVEAYKRFKQESGIDILTDGGWGRNLGAAVRFVLDNGMSDLSLVIAWCDRVSREAKQLLGETECHS